MTRILLMTATVTPRPGSLALDRVDPVVRMDDYKRAFAFYLDNRIHAFDRIVFCENSGADLSALEGMARLQKLKEVEFISTYGLDYPVEFIRGYGEFKLIDWVASHSHFWQELDDFGKIWKVTGRLIVRNINQVVRRTPSQYDLCAEFRPRCQWVDTRLLAFSKSGYQNLFQGTYESYATSPIEQVLYQRFQGNSLQSGNQRPEPIIKREFGAVPRFSGFAGWKNSNYDSMRSRMIWLGKSLYREFMRILARKAQHR